MPSNILTVVDVTDGALNPNGTVSVVGAATSTAALAANDASGLLIVPVPPLAPFDGYQGIGLSVRTNPGTLPVNITGISLQLSAQIDISVDNGGPMEFVASINGVSLGLSQGSGIYNNRWTAAVNPATGLAWTRATALAASASITARWPYYGLSGDDYDRVSVNAACMFITYTVGGAEPAPSTVTPPGVGGTNVTSALATAALLVGGGSDAGGGGASPGVVTSGSGACGWGGGDVGLGLCGDRHGSYPLWGTD